MNLRRSAGFVFLAAMVSAAALMAQQQEGAPAGRGGGAGRGGAGRGGGQGGTQDVVGGVNAGGGAGRGRGRNAGPPPQPAPRNAEGRAILGGANPKDKGVWLPVFGITDPIKPAKDTPFQPWAKAVFDDRQKNELEPHTRCKPSGVARQFLTPYGVEFVELTELDRLYIFDIGGPHTYRTVYMDGRTHPTNLTPSYYGHSVGWWEGDTLNVDTIGYNENFWLDRRGMPHTEALHTLEKFTRTDSATIKYEVTVNDPGAYTAPWTTSFNLRRETGTELFEYVCQQANYASELMVGGNKSVDRTSQIIP
ncbi:MAG TPA: hypothetical protein VH436_18600 [Vicinamibacterales bacterium]|jgi:hypothetical protein